MVLLLGKSGYGLTDRLGKAASRQTKQPVKEVSSLGRGLWQRRARIRENTRAGWISRLRWRRRHRCGWDPARAKADGYSERLRV